MSQWMNEVPGGWGWGGGSCGGEGENGGCWSKSHQSKTTGKAVSNRSFLLLDIESEIDAQVHPERDGVPLHRGAEIIHQFADGQFRVSASQQRIDRFALRPTALQTVQRQWVSQHFLLLLLLFWRSLTIPASILLATPTSPPFIQPRL